MDSFDIECVTGNGIRSVPGTIGTPVIKSLDRNGRRTTDLEHEGARSAGSRSKCSGTRTTGICDICL